MRLLWWPALISLLVSSWFLARAIYVYRRNRIPLPASLLGGIALNGGLALLIVPQFLGLSYALRWITLGGSAILLIWSLRLSRRALAKWL